jgi:hypothetical protein
VTGARTRRDRWLTEVMFSCMINDSCRRLLLCYGMVADTRGPWMSESGRVRPIRHRTLADALGIAPKTVANLILQATRAGLLEKDPTSGHRGRPAAYQATFPAAGKAAAGSPSTLWALLPDALKVPVSEEPFPPGFREPFGGSDGTKVPEIREAQRARGGADARASVSSVRNATTPTSTGDATPPADGVRGTRPRMRAAATPPAERHGQDRLGDYLDGRPRLSTQVEQGDHRPRARRDRRER